MSGLDIYAIIEKLAGPIRPVGESHTDRGRLKNLKAMGELVVQLVDAIHCVEDDFGGNYQASMKEASVVAGRILDEIGIPKDKERI